MSARFHFGQWRIMFVAAMLLFPSAAFSQDYSADSELVSAWKIVRALIRTADVTRRVEYYDSTSPDQKVQPLRDTQTYRNIWNREAGWVWEARHQKANKNEEPAARTLINPDYLISITAARGKPGSWIIGTDDGEPSFTDDKKREVMTHAPWDVLPWVDGVTDVNLVDWFAKPTVTHVSTVPIPQGTRRTYKQPLPSKPRSPLDVMVILQLDVSDQPTRHIIAAQFTINSNLLPIERSTSLIYDEPTADGIPVLRVIDTQKVNIQALPGEPLTRRTRTINVDAKYNGPEQKHLFYLSHYGLPEPHGVTPPSPPTPNYVWLLLAAGGFAVLAVGTRWLLKRRARAAANASPPTAPPPPTTT
jgi:hypothetical protein